MSKSEEVTNYVEGLLKASFVPAGPQMDPAMAGGMPPGMDPAMMGMAGGMPPGGGMPPAMDPMAAGGAPMPMDPAAAAAMGPGTLMGAPAGMAPEAVAAPAPPEPAPAASEGDKPKGKASGQEERLARIESMLAKILDTAGIPMEASTMVNPTEAPEQGQPQQQEVPTETPGGVQQIEPIPGVEGAKTAAGVALPTVNVTNDSNLSRSRMLQERLNQIMGSR